MRYDPLQARVMLVDGPVAVFLHEASQMELRAALMRLQKVIDAAVIELGVANDKAFDALLLKRGEWIPFTPGGSDDPARTQR